MGRGVQMGEQILLGRPRQLQLAYRLDVNEWRNQRNLQLVVEAIAGF